MQGGGSNEEEGLEEGEIADNVYVPGGGGETVDNDNRDDGEEEVEAEEEEGEYVEAEEDEGEEEMGEEEGTEDGEVGEELEDDGEIVEEEEFVVGKGASATNVIEMTDTEKRKLMEWHQDLEVKSLKGCKYPIVRAEAEPVEMWLSRASMQAIVKMYVRGAKDFVEENYVEYYTKRQAALTPDFHGIVDMLDVSVL